MICSIGSASLGVSAAAAVPESAANNVAAMDERKIKLLRGCIERSSSSVVMTSRAPCPRKLPHYASTRCPDSYPCR